MRGMFRGLPAPRTARGPPGALEPVFWGEGSPTKKNDYRKQRCPDSNLSAGGAGLVELGLGAWNWGVTPRGIPFGGGSVTEMGDPHLLISLLR